MTDPASSLEALGSADLLRATRRLVRKSHGVEAELLVHLGEIDERKLYLPCAHPSMFAFCVDELGFSEDAAYNRITVARAGRRLPAVIEAARSGRVHLAGLRLLAPHLTADNHEAVLSEAAGKSKRQIEELVARLAPLPPAPAVIRKLPECPAVRWAPMPARVGALTDAGPAPSVPDTAAGDTAASDTAGSDAAAAAAAVDAGPAAFFPAMPQARRDGFQAVVPLSGETFKVQFTASRALRDKLQEAQELLRHRVPDGDIPTIVEEALDILIAQVKKDRFAVGRSARPASGATAERSEPATSRHIPDAIKRAVYERDGGRCTFVDEHGRRCKSTGPLEFDHEHGFARAPVHSIEGIRLLCRAHNQYVAEQMYGRAFMEQARGAKDPRATRPGTS